MIIERNKSYKNGDVVLAMVDGEFTLKYYQKKGDEIILKPANSAYSTIKPQNELKIIGVMIGLVRKMK